MGKSEISGRGQEQKKGKRIREESKTNKKTNLKFKAKQISRNVNKHEGMRAKFA